MRHRFQDSCKMNVPKRKLYRNIKSTRTWSSRNIEFLREIMSFLPLKFEDANYLFPIQRFLCIFHDPVGYWL